MINNGNNIKRYFLVITILLYNFILFSVDTSGVEILRNMLHTVDSVNSFQFTLKTKERFNEEYFEEYGKIKVVFNPYKVFYKQLSPNDGLEIMFDKDKYGEKAKVKTNVFPYLSFYMSPYSNQMRKNRHHTLFEVGFIKYMANATRKIINNKSGDVQILYKGLYKINGVLCYKVQILNSDFKVIEYKVKETENIIDIANKYNVCDYMIIELNNNVTDYNDITEGQTIKIPNYYAKEIEFNIHKELLIPVLIKIFDDKGLFEEYYFKDIIID